LLDPLVCPACGKGHLYDQRFCTRCDTPLVFAPGVRGDGDTGDREALERLRKIRPEFARGELTRVATARHQAEAEMLQGMLLEEGIPSLLRRSGGFDVPDFLASGPRDVLVPAAGAMIARELLGTTGAIEHAAEAQPAWVRALAVALAVAVLAIIAAGVFSAVFS
jgi:hypothetical protein